MFPPHATARVILALALVLIVALGVGHLRDPLVGHHDHRMSESAGMARNFSRLGMNPLLPRVDWGGSGPGYIEEAAQVYAFSVAVLYTIAGEHEYLGRGLSFASYLVTATLLLMLFRRHTSDLAAAFAVLFFSMSPLAGFYGHAFQPDMFALMLSVAGILTFDLWLERRSPGFLVVSAICVAAAGITKPPHLYIGLPMLYIAVQRRGWAVLRSAAVWVYAASVLVPVVLWYAHAHRLWVEYGNTAGIWGEGFSKFGPEYLLGFTFYDVMGRRLLRLITPTPTGLLIVVGFVVAWLRSQWMVLVWLAGFAVIAVLTAGAQLPHDYYQVPLGAIMSGLMGVGAAFLWAGAATGEVSRVRLLTMRGAVVVICGLGVVESIRISHERFDPPPITATELAFGRRVQELTPAGSLVLVVRQEFPIGPDAEYRHRDPDGLRFAADPQELYRSDRKGWTIHANRLTPEIVASVRQKGARYLITRQVAMFDRQKDAVAFLRREGVELDRTADWVIFALERH